MAVGTSALLERNSHDLTRVVGLGNRDELHNGEDERLQPLLIELDFGSIF